MAQEHKVFRNAIAENIYNQKYSGNGRFKWNELAEVLVDEVCGTMGGTRPSILKQEELGELTQIISGMEAVPGGRYLYYAGKPLHAWNNCGHGDTKLLTSEGWVRFRDVAGREVMLLSPVDGRYKPAIVHSHGRQAVYKYTMAPIRGKSKQTYEVKFTEDHKWLLKNGTTTTDLRVGDVVPASTVSLDTDDVGFAHGFVFGDGSGKGQLRLCAQKDLAHLDRLQKTATTITYPEFAGGDPCLFFKDGANGKWKKLPEKGSSPEYIASFLRGWIAADGSNERVLCSVNREAMLWFREHAAFAGLVITGELRHQDRDVVIGNYSYKNHRIYIQNWVRGEAWAGFKVISKEYVGEEDVYCPFEPEFNQIVIDHGIRTFNCYLLKGEEDTREEWGNLAKRASDCLMSGGGIGVDYSVFRPKGSKLNRTGGTASGPIPLMHSINEIGRNVMQGGSRRSAIYASLHYNHPDAQQFLRMKDWHNMQIAKNGYTVWDAKQFDPNYPAPLDMTNVSLNYDDDWGFDPDHPTFLTNVEQACMTGEPGFSFNFGRKRHETLRNACTEVTSEDESDVCNLGSVNMSRIPSVERMYQVAYHMSRFLVCGTLRADLPYDKVYDVRDKNRRLGLGLMGIAEWLHMRGYGYEVVNELHVWLDAWRRGSEDGANELCDRLGISRPVAYRAIAPTGTIGMIAGTTTGIEPLFAVAYIRKYLKGTKWYYQYVIDGTAQVLIEQGVSPDAIETAYGMANDVERRIRFQADVQDYVDMAISSTINMPAWGSDANNPDTVGHMAKTLAKYAPRLRGFTVYPDGARGGQPLTEVPYSEALLHGDVVYEDNDSCKGGVCGI